MSPASRAIRAYMFISLLAIVGAAVNRATMGQHVLGLSGGQLFGLSVGNGLFCYFVLAPWLKRLTRTP